MNVAVDTNVLVRLLADDGSADVTKVIHLVASNHIVIVPTVVLETEWVLRVTIGLSRDQIAMAFERLLGLVNATVVQRDALMNALAAYRGGCDFADAYHHSLAAGADAFATLDKKFARRATTLGLMPHVQAVV